MRFGVNIAVNSVQNVGWACSPTIALERDEKRWASTPTLRQFLCAFVFAIILLLSCLPAPAHDSPIDHIDRTVQIYIDSGKVHVVYRFRCEERQVLLQLKQMDNNRDGKISDDERNAYFTSVSSQMAGQLRIEIDGQPAKLSNDGPVQLAPDLSQTYHLSAPLADLSIGAHAGKFTDDFSRTHPGPYRWSPRQLNRNGIEVEATAAPGIEQSDMHPAMIVVNLKIVVRPPPATQPGRVP